MEYYAAQRKKKEFLPFVTVQMELGNIRLNEISQLVKDIRYDLTYNRKLMNKIN